MFKKHLRPYWQPVYPYDDESKSQHSQRGQRNNSVDHNINFVHLHHPFFAHSTGCVCRSIFGPGPQPCRCEGWKLHDTNNSASGLWVNICEYQHDLSQKWCNKVIICFFYPLLIYLCNTTVHDLNYASSRMYQDLLLLHTIFLLYLLVPSDLLQTSAVPTASKKHPS